MSKENPLAAGSACWAGPVFLPWGIAAAVAEAGRLVAVVWEESEPALKRRLFIEFPGALAVGPAGNEAGALLAAYAKGIPVRPEKVRRLVAWELAGAFDRAVLRAALAIPFGRTSTYGALAAAAGFPKAARAAGAALARNRWPVLVPCHRVVRASGSLAGFAKGTQAKWALLEHERTRAGRL